ncbi:MAG: hypothetical protein AB7P18_22175 [Candidatus Binatia bacterium]
MAVSVPIVLDPTQGEARLGVHRVAIAPVGSDGTLRVGGTDGPVLGPVTFAERTALTTRALAAAQPCDYVCAGILHAATKEAGVADQLEQELLALTLAGAGEDGPPFAQTLALVAQETGWGYDRLAETAAVEVDRLAIQLTEVPADGGWQRYLLATDTRGELASLRNELADNLLRRASVGEVLFASAATETRPLVTHGVHHEPLPETSIGLSSAGKRVTTTTSSTNDVHDLFSVEVEEEREVRPVDKHSTPRLFARLRKGEGTQANSPMTSGAGLISRQENRRRDTHAADSVPPPSSQNETRINPTDVEPKPHAAEGARQSTSTVLRREANFHAVRPQPDVASRAGLEAHSPRIFPRTTSTDGFRASPVSVLPVLDGDAPLRQPLRGTGNAPVSAPAFAQTEGQDDRAAEVAEILARLLDEEADLRGVER